MPFSKKLLIINDIFLLLIIGGNTITNKEQNTESFFNENLNNEIHAEYPTFLEERNVWRIAAGDKNNKEIVWKEFKEHEFVSIGWFDKGYFRDYRTFNSEEDIYDQLKKDNPNTSDDTKAPKMIWDFTHEIKVGDIVVANFGNQKYCGIGIVVSDYIPADQVGFKYEMNHIRKVKWQILDEITNIKQFGRHSVQELDSDRWNAIIASYARAHPEYGDKLIRFLYNEFAKTYFFEENGIEHEESYQKSFEWFKDKYNKILNKKNNGEEYWEDVWNDLIINTPSPATVYGNSLNFYIQQHDGSIENTKLAGEAIFDLITNLIKVPDDNLEEQSRLLKEFKENENASKGLQAGTLSQAFYFLNPYYLLINKKSKDTINFLNMIFDTGFTVDTKLEDYADSNLALHKFLEVLKEKVSCFKEFTNFDIFAHWLCTSDLGGYAKDKFLPLIDFGKEDNMQTPELDLKPDYIQSKLIIPDNLKPQLCASLNSNHHIILNGAPGTGKTVLAKDICNAVHKIYCMDYILTTATSDWTTFDTIGGLMPKDDGSTLEFVEGKFLQAIKENKWLIIDEINRADIDKAFGQLFTVLSGQGVELPYKLNGQSIKIEPTESTDSYFDDSSNIYYVGKNWRIIGTMNVYDKDYLYDLSYAFMRRFTFINVDLPSDNDYEELIDDWGKDLDSYYLDKIKIILKINKYRKLGPAIFNDLMEYIRYRNAFDDEKDLILEEAIFAYIMPQFEGLNKKKLEDIKVIFSKENFENEEFRKNIEAKIDQISGKI